MSTDKLNEAGYEVQLSKKNPHMRRAKNGEITRLRRKGGQFIMDIWMKTPEAGFHGQEK